ncbi:MAG: hypothetical protein QM639_18575 [Rhodocyclaceae bacterium]|jgi:hypothetical protein
MEKAEASLDLTRPLRAARSDAAPQGIRIACPISGFSPLFLIIN